MTDSAHRRPQQALHAWSADLVTRSGTPIRIRVVGIGDRPLLADFFHHVSQEDLRFRFLTSLREVDAGRLDALCVVDPPHSITFLAFSGNDLVAVATLAGQSDRAKAEIALATRPEWKSRGVSWALFDHVIRYARAEGFRELLSIEKADNSVAIQLEREMGFSIRLVDDDGGDVVASRPIPSN